METPQELLAGGLSDDEMAGENTDDIIADPYESESDLTLSDEDFTHGLVR